MLNAKSNVPLGANVTQLTLIGSKNSRFFQEKEFPGPMADDQMTEEVFMC
jgi:hypothetical protein